MTDFLHHQLEEFRLGNDVLEADSDVLLDALIESSDELLLADVFRAWNDKRIAEGEIYSIAKIIRGRMTRVNSKHETFVDIVGTGGSTVKTFNVSTAASFVVAGAGIPVAKHGNKAATSRSGSADVLTQLGIEPAVDAATAERCLNQIGLCFMFAPNFHLLSSTLGKVRRSLGFPTIFNCVGPLCNPASAPHQLIGVWNRELVSKMATVLARLGTKRSWIVHGDDGLDEISLSGPTTVAEIEGDRVGTFEVSPGDFGTDRRKIDELRKHDAISSSMIVRDVLQDTMKDSPTEAIVLINAAAALQICGKAESLRTGFEIAKESIRSGAAAAKMNLFAAELRK